jgi:cellulose 1,4-beta-cellobiosidase
MWKFALPVVALAAALAPVRATPIFDAGNASTTAPSPSGTASSSNPFAGYQIYANPYYASEIASSAIPSMTGAAQAAASEVAKVGTFQWLDTAAKVPLMSTFLADISNQNKAGASPPIMGAFVVYDLPDRDCAAAASNGEYSIADGGVEKYKAYIDSIAAALKAQSDVHVALIVEPDSLANLVTNMNVPKCANAADAYKECINYALTTLNIAQVAMYLDAGHAGWLGWPANLAPAAQLFAEVYQNASSPASLRGLATNVANYNAWSIDTCPPYTQGDTNCDEKRYVNALAPLLANASFPAHFVTDVSRNGVQPTQQQQWGDWCNVIGTGFGVRPTSDTGDDLEDAFVWIKPGGECDGTSNQTSTRYDYHCGYADALQPAPEAGAWFQAYFEQLVMNANPPFSS